MWTTLFQTGNDPVATFARVVLGLVMFPHGAQHLLGWFGGYGYRGTMNWFLSLGVPAPIASFAIFAEFFGAIALVFGFGGRFAALAIVVIALGSGAWSLDRLIVRSS